MTFFVRVPIKTDLAIVYHMLLTAEQSKKSEELQSRTLKINYGYKRRHLYKKRPTKIERLSESRLRLIDSFIVKCSESERFTERWFPKNSSLSTT